MHCKDRPVGPGRAIEGDPETRRFHRLADRGFVGAGADETAAMDVEVLTSTTGALHALEHPGRLTSSR